MSSFDEKFRKATAPGPDRVIAGCVLSVYKDGTTYTKSFGTQSVDADSSLVNEPIAPDTTMWIASCTKLMTAISAMQCVEKGLFTLDDDISIILPEWKERNVLKGFDASGKPDLVKSTAEKLTLRQLLTHSSGLGYVFMNPELEQLVEYEKSIGQERGQKIRESYLFPLLFEPGSSWNYGVSIDWAGQMVERVSKKSLETYMQDHIWKPLGMNSTTFRLQDHEDIKNRRADMSKRDADGTVVASETRYYPEEWHDDHGGGGVYASPADYVKVLAALVKNDGTLLEPASVDELFRPCLSDPARDKLQGARGAQEDDSFDMAIGAPTSVDYAVGGMVNLEDIEGGRKGGTLSWGGLPNLSWIVDRKDGVALLYSSQLLPPGDPKTKQIVRTFEAAVFSGEFFEGAVKS